MRSEEQSQIITVERLIQIARSKEAQDPRVLCKAVEDELSRAAIYVGPTGDGVRAHGAEHAADAKSVVVVVSHLNNGVEEKVPFLAFFELYKPIALT